MRQSVRHSAIIIILLAATAAFGAETAEMRLNLDLKDVPFPEVIRQVFDGSAESYSVDPALNDMKVSATLKNVTKSEAIRVITRTAGIDYFVDASNTYVFKPNPQAAAAPPVTVPTAVTPGSPTTSQIITLKYLRAGDAASMLSASPPDGLVGVIATSANTLLVKGSEAATKQAQSLIAAFDVEDVLPHSIRLALSLKISGPGLKSPLSLSTESVGTEGSPMPLNLNSTGTHVCMLDAKLTPNVMPDGSVSLTGSGAIDCNLSEAQASVRRTQRLSKAFEVAAPATAGTPVVVASGSVDDASGKLEFRVSVTATVEKGRIAAPRAAARPPTVAVSKPDEAHRKAADAVLEQIWKAAPGQAKFDAIDDVVSKYRESDIAAQNAIGWMCVTYMSDWSADFQKRWPCRYVIGRSNCELGLPALVQILLHDQMEMMRAVAAEALGGLPDNAEAHDALVQSSRTEDKPASQRRARQVFGQ